MSNSKKQQKSTNEHNKKRQKRRKRAQETEVMEQDETFYFIAGYTSGGAPYGVTWEEMGLGPWEKEEWNPVPADEELPFG